MRALYWLIFGLLFPGIILLVLVVADGRDTELRLTQEATAQKLARGLLEIESGLAFELAANLPEDAETKAKRILTKLSGDMALVIRRPNGSQFLFVTSMEDRRSPLDLLEKCRQQLGDNKEIIGKVNIWTSGTLEALSCQVLNTADDSYNEPPDPPEWTTFAVWEKRHVEWREASGVALGLAMLLLGAGMLLSLVLAAANSLRSNAAAASDKRPPQQPAPRHAPSPSTEPLSFGFEAVIVPTGHPGDETSSQAGLVPIATISLRKVDRSDMPR